MTFLHLLADGFRSARRRPGLVLIAYLVPLVPALVLAIMAHATLAPTFDYTLAARSILDGSWNRYWGDFTASPADHLPVIFGSGVSLMLLLTALVQIPVAAGIVESLIQGEAAQSHPFLTGVGTHTWRFARAAVWFLVAAGLVAGAAGGTVSFFFKLAEKRTDARFDIVGVAAAAVLALLLLALIVPAYDLTRLAAARHEDRKTLRGFGRSLWTVFRHPGIFLPLAGSFALLAAALHLGYYAARSPWTPATAVAVAALFLAQQLVMVVRAFFHVAFWGAELAAYRHLDEPRLCEKRTRRKRIVIDEPDLAVAPIPAPDAALEPLPGEPAAIPSDSRDAEPGVTGPDDVFEPPTSS